MVSLATACLVSFVVLLVLCLFSRFSSAESKGGAYGRAQLTQICAAAAKRASFYAGASRQDESAVMALLHACEARAHAMAAKDLAERCNVEPDRDLLELLEESQDHVDALVYELHHE
jgi:hypothetical protein